MELLGRRGQQLSSRASLRIAAQTDRGQGPEIVIYDVGVVSGKLTITSQTFLKSLGLFTNMFAAEPDFGKVGDRIALEANLPSGDADIWIVDLSGTATAFNLTQTLSVFEINPSWSPDGTEIVFRRQPFVGGNLGFPVGLYKINVTSHALTKLAQTGNGIGDLRYPDWRRNP